MVAMATVGSDYGERVSEQCCYTSGYYHGGLCSDHQRITSLIKQCFFVLFSINALFCDGRTVVLLSIRQL